jgi:hypothetical protein
MANTTPERRQIIDPVMREITAYVAANPGCPKFWPATFCGPHESVKHGFRAVDRTLAAGLIEDRAPEDSAGHALYVTAAGTVMLRG